MGVHPSPAANALQDLEHKTQRRCSLQRKPLDYPEDFLVGSPLRFFPQALKEKEEVYTVNIGPKRGIENFFRIETLNGEVIIREQLPHTRQYDSNSCPFNVSGALDNSLFPPFVQPDTPLSIVAIESCRVLPLTYQRQERYNGLDTFRYTLLQSHQKPPGCLDTSYGVKLPDGMFDVSQCVISTALRP